MNSKLFFPVLMAVSTVWAVQWYFGRNAGQPVQQGVVNISERAEASGGVVKVQKTKDLMRPLVTDVEFMQQKATGAEEITRVETKNVIATFTNFGGQLKELSFKNHLGRNRKPLKTTYDRGVFDEQEGVKHCFLMALDKDTPYVYSLERYEQHDGRHVIEYRAQNNHWDIRKTFTLNDISYNVDVDFSVTTKQKNDDEEMHPRLFFVAPVTHELVDDVVVPFVLNESRSGIDKIELAKITDSAWYWNTSKIIFGAENRYFAHTLINDPSHFVQRAYFTNFPEETAEKNADQKAIKVVSAILEGPALDDNGESSWSLSFYMGPKVQRELARVDERLQELLSFGWLSWFCTLIVKLLSYLYQLIGNYGFAIIALTVLVRIPFVPLSVYSRRRMEEYQKHQPHINRIRTKYKTDVKVQQHEVIRYHREHNLSPATPIIGCLPLLLQIPIFLSLYRVLWSYLDLYQAPFFGWIVDLSAKDPYYILPVLMGITMIWQQSMTSVVDDKQRVISLFMGVVMTILFASFPAGLVLYWFMSNVLTLIEDYTRKAFVRS